MTVSASSAATASSARTQLARESGVDPISHMCVWLYTTSPETTRLRPGTWTRLECPVSEVPTGITVAAEPPTGIVVPASGTGGAGLSGWLAGKKTAPDLHVSRRDLFFHRGDGFGQGHRPGLRELRQDLRQPEEVVGVGMGDVDVPELAVVRLHPRRQFPPLLFGDEAVDQQGAVIVTDQGRGGRRPGRRAHRLLETRHGARDRLGRHREHVETKAHRFLLWQGCHASCSPARRQRGIRTLTAPLPAAGAVMMRIPSPRCAARSW